MLKSQANGKPHKEDIEKWVSPTFLLVYRRSDGVSSMPKNEFALACLLYTSDAADERSSVDLGGRRNIKKKEKEEKEKEKIALKTLPNITSERDT